MMNNKLLLSGLLVRNSEVVFGYNFNKSRIKKWLKIMTNFQLRQFLDLGTIK